jgi:hypothetical protein
VCVVVCGSESTMRTMAEAISEAEKHASRSEPLAALLAEATAALEQARAAVAERARVAAEEAAAAAAVKAAAAAERQQLEEEMAALDARRQQVQAKLGSTSARVTQEELCIVCLDAPKDHIIVPCGHQCVCGACAQRLKRTASPRARCAV